MLAPSQFIADQTPNNLSTLVSKKNGFTLVELLISLSIVSVVFGVILTSTSAIQRNARNSMRQTDLRNIQSALQLYFADQNFFPDGSFILTADFDNSLTSSDGGNPNQPTAAKIYLRQIPKDPLSTSAYCYQAQDLAGGGVSCDNSDSDSARRCQQYSLFAALEGSPPGNESCLGKTYNYKLTPN